MNVLADCPSDKAVKVISQYDNLYGDYVTLVALVNDLRCVSNARAYAACLAVSADLLKPSSVVANRRWTSPTIPIV